ncbi:MAG: LptF/LptG family permease [Alphaproteobacteria bacterium]|nr:LptF/LptG family permease [Alphaproteobacteria bacterium]
MDFRLKIFTKFLMRRWFLGFGLVVLVVSAVIFSVTFVERLPQEAGAMDSLFTSWALLLRYIPLFLPLAVFMGTLVTTYNLTRSSENVIISGAGLSPYQSTRPFLIAAFFVGVLSAALLNPYAVYINRSDIGSEQIDMTDSAIWLRETTDFGTFTMRATGISYGDMDTLVFTDVSAFVLDDESKFQQRIEAAEIILSTHSFYAPIATIYSTDGLPTEITDWNISSLMTPDAVLERHLRPEHVSFWRLPMFIRNLENMGLNSRGHKIQFFTLLFLPLTLIAMATLGVAFSQSRQRRNHSFGVKFGAGILTCFILYFIINVFGALGASGALPPLIAVLSPPLIVMIGAAIFIVSYDNI